MIINISEILANPSAQKSFNVNLDLSGISFKGRTFPVSEKSPFCLNISREDKILHISGATEVKVLIPCDRCLDDVEFTFPISIDESVKLDGDSGGDNDELYYIDGCMLDVDKLVCDEIVVALPTKVLCKEDCKGLCSVCGTNLNHGSCDCDTETLDPRMAAIKDIFLNFHED